jgi:hypothetical protein
MPDDSGWAIYDAAAAVHRERTPLADDTAQVRLAARIRCGNSHVITWLWPVLAAYLTTLTAV